LSSYPLIPDLQTLTALFYPSRESLGQFSEVSLEEVPQPYRGLLAHNDHMTVAVEDFHRGPVTVRVLQRQVTTTHYAREILLARQADGEVVQYGIMRVNFAYLPREVQEKIHSEQTPLGRVLIEHNVLRRVQLFSLRRVELGDVLRRCFNRPKGGTTYGRTALIECNQTPAIELLEIVAPIESAKQIPP
jgi:chorismate-pyruvate lyase